MIRVAGAARRWQRLAAPSLVLLALTLAFGARGAAADTGWCFKEPLVRINGQLVDVSIAVPVEGQFSGTAPIRLTLTVPEGTSTELVSADDGLGYGWDVSFAESDRLEATATSLPVRVRLSVPSSMAGLPVVADVTPVDSGPVHAAEATGTVNRTILFTTP